MLMYRVNWFWFWVCWKVCLVMLFQVEERCCSRFRVIFLISGRCVFVCLVLGCSRYLWISLISGWVLMFRVLVSWVFGYSEWQCGGLLICGMVMNSELGSVVFCIDSSWFQGLSILVSCVMLFWCIWLQCVQLSSSGIRQVCLMFRLGVCLVSLLCIVR